MTNKEYLERQEFVNTTLNGLLKGIDPDIFNVAYQRINNVEQITIYCKRKPNIKLYVTGLSRAELSIEAIKVIS